MVEIGGSNKSRTTAKKRFTKYVVEWADDTISVSARVKDQERRSHLLDALRKSSGKRQLLSLFAKLATIPDQVARERSAMMQPQVPRRLHEQLTALARLDGQRRVTERLKHTLENWIDFGLGKRRSKRSKGRRLNSRPERLTEFKRAGKALAREPDQVRLSFNAGTTASKRAINQLIEKLDMSMSEFFAALVDRTVAEANHVASADIAPASVRIPQLCRNEPHGACVGMRS